VNDLPFVCFRFLSSWRISSAFLDLSILSDCDRYVSDILLMPGDQLYFAILRVKVKPCHIQTSVRNLERHVGNTDLETLVLKVIAKASIPVGVGYVAKRIRRNWATTRAVLLTLAVDGRVSVQRTTHGWYYRSANSMRGIPGTTKPLQMQARKEGQG